MINSSSIDTVLLDMDGTLLDLSFDNYFWQAYVPMQYAKQNGLSKAEGFAKLAAWTNAQIGTLNWYSLPYWSQELGMDRSEEHTSELQSRFDLVCRLLLEKKNT